jgi:hypothetical protein
MLGDDTSKTQARLCPTGASPQPALRLSQQRSRSARGVQRRACATHVLAVGLLRCLLRRAPSRRGQQGACKTRRLHAHTQSRGGQRRLMCLLALLVLQATAAPWQRLTGGGTVGAGSEGLSEGRLYLPPHLGCDKGRLYLPPHLGSSSIAPNRPQHLALSTPASYLQPCARCCADASSTA